MNHTSAYLRSAPIVLFSFLCACDPTRIAAGVAVDQANGAWIDQTENELVVGRALPSLLIQLEGLHESDPTRSDLTILLARLYGLYAQGFLELEGVPLRDTTTEPFGVTRSERAVLSALSRAHTLLNEVLSQSGLEATPDEVNRIDNPRLAYWLGFILIQEMRLVGGPAILEFDFARALLARAHQLDPRVEYGSAEWLLLAVDCVNPLLSAETTRQSYQGYLEAHSNAAARLAFVESCLIPQGNTSDAASVLSAIVDMPNAMPVLLHRLAQERARWLLTAESFRPAAPTNSGDVSEVAEVAPTQE